MRKVLSVVLAATMAMSLAACGGSGAKTDTKTDTKAADAGTAAGDEASADDYYITIKFSNVFQPAEWNYKASEYLADLVKEKTDGHITLEYYGQNQLDCYAESVAQAHNGAVWMGLEEPSYFADYIGDYNVLVRPMLYKNNAEYNAVMDSVNLEEVREKAMDDLGMVYANENQVVEYDNPDGDYIKQYEQIPDEGVVASSAKTNE